MRFNAGMMIKRGTITMAKPTYSDINNKTIFLIQAKKLNDNNLIPAQDYGYEVINAIEYDEWYNRKTRYGYTLYDGFDMEGSGHRFLQEYLNTQYIPVGSVEYVEEYIRQCYRIQSVIPLNVPLQLYKYVNRFATIIGNEEFENKLIPDRKYFIKSATKIKGYSDFIIPKKAKDIPHDTYFVSEIIDIETEWRCFVKDGELLDIRCYSGNPFVMPDIYTIKKMIKEYTDCPPAYTLDVCKTSDGITSIVECHNFFSCGLYGFSDYKNYLIMLIRAFRWQVTKGKK